MAERKKVSRVPGVVSTRKPAGATGGRTSAVTPEPRREVPKGPKAVPPSAYGELDTAPRRAFSKGPTQEQWTVMAGAMYNALEALRKAHDFIRSRADANEGWLQPIHVPLVLIGIAQAENILRVGLKARFRK
jgi:hypothetical protein